MLSLLIETRGHVTGERLCGSRRLAAVNGFLLFFKEEIIKIFDHSVYGQEASLQLVTLRQGRRSAADYAIEFGTLAATCEWNEQALTARFLEGLSEEIKEDQSRDLPTRLDQLVELAIRLDKRFELHRRARTSMPELWAVPPIVSVPTVAAPDHGHTQREGLCISPAERQRRIVGGLCLYCGAQGHFATRCPVKERARQ